MAGLKILLFHPVILPPQGYGGIERVVLWLAKGLMELGHHVTLVAREGSKKLPPFDMITVNAEDSSPQNFIKKKMPNSIDVVHFMAPPGSESISKLNCASLTTIHGNGYPGEEFPLNSVFLSRNHAERNNSDVFVYNGVDPAEFHYEESKKSSFLFLSKTSWKVKNVLGAIRVCKKAKVPLSIAGGRRPLWARLQVSCSRGMSWYGEVSGSKKAELLSRSKALIFPVLWPEPFGLVLVESLMSGTPVIASPRGSVPEIITPDVGELPKTEEAWIHSLEGFPRKSSEKCRSRAMDLFHYSKMALSYESLYRRVIGGESLHTRPPVSSGWLREKSLNIV